MDLLKDFCCHFLFEEQRVVVEEEPPGEVPFHELMVDTKFHPYVTLRFGEITATAVWDTGASRTVADMSFINTYPTLFQEAGTSQGTDATGAIMETPLFIMASPNCVKHIGCLIFPARDGRFHNESKTDNARSLYALCK